MVQISPRFNEFARFKPILFLEGKLSGVRGGIRRLYAWVVGWAATPMAEKALAGIAFIESSVFPIPPDPLLIAMSTASPRRYLRFAAICTVASVLGGILGYGIGVLLFESVGSWIIKIYGLEETFAYIGQRYEANAFLTVFTAAFTPVPYKLITIAGGVFRINFFQFIVASIIGRGARFFLVSTLVSRLGEKYKDMIERYVDALSLLFVVVLVLGFVMFKFVI